MANAIANISDFQLITFDVWNTLIVANPEFSRLRTQTIATEYDISFEDAKEAYTSVKHFLDQSAEIASVCMNTPQCWRLLDVTIQRLRRKQGLEPVNVDYVGLSAYCNNLFRANLPIFSESTKTVLLNLQSAGKTLGIISNTNFIPGGLLWEELFMELNVFEDPYFSDQHELPKPHKFAFRGVRQHLCSVANTTNHDVLHVGDNLICDGAASHNPGYKFLHVERPDHLVQLFNSAGF